MELPIITEARRIDEGRPKIFMWQREGRPDIGSLSAATSFTLTRKSEGAGACYWRKPISGSKNAFMYRYSSNSGTTGNYLIVWASCESSGRSKTFTHA